MMELIRWGMLGVDVRGDRVGSNCRRHRRSRPIAPAAIQTDVGEAMPSDDAVIKNFRCLGLVNGKVNIFRSACPVRDLGKEINGKPTDAQMAEAISRMKHLYELGIRTIVSFQGTSANDDEAKSGQTAAMVALEKSSAEAVGIRYVQMPISNAGPDSLETMSDEQVMAKLQAVVDEIFKDAESGGVLFHCSAGHDRAGIVTAYIRIKYEHWPVEQAIAEMRRYGHNWPKFSSNGGTSSWHEEHLRGISKKLEESKG